jgi:hypothetical protein
MLIRRTTEYGQECWCGNALAAGAVSAPAADCRILCADNLGEYCGGSSRLNVYRAGALVSSSSSSTTLSLTPTSSQASSSSTGGASTTSVASSSTTTQSSLETSSSSQSTTTVSSISPSQSSSSKLSSSSTSQSTSTSQESTSITRQSSTSPTPTGPSIRHTVGPYTFQGCYTEATIGRALSSKTYASDTMTLETCAAFCTEFQWFGVEYRRECYCGNAPNTGSILAANQGDCNLLCIGDPTTFCGAGVRLQMYKLVSSSTTLPTTT